MRKIALSSVVCAWMVLAVGCSFLKKKGDADASAEGGADTDAEVAAVAPPADDAAPPPAPAPAPAPVTAKNAAEVARFAAETAISDDDLKLAVAAPARTTPKGGNVVATLKPGGDVTKVAEYQECILVTFADPKDAASSLMGWIGKEAFVHVAVKKDAGVGDSGVRDAAPAPVVDAGTKPTATCPTGKVSVVLSKDPVCRTRCTKDADCKGGKAGACAVAQTAAGSAAKVCIADQ